MQYTAIIKRAIPFLLSATAGFVIASFFVPITAPNFGSKSRSWGKRHDCKQMKREFPQMREENIRLRMELENARREISELSADADVESHGPNGLREFKMIIPPPPVAPAAPEPPTYRGRIRVERTR